MSSPWSWIVYASYKGRVTVGGKPTDVWGTTVLDMEWDVGVLASNNTVPVFFNTQWIGQTSRNITFTTFQPVDCLDVIRFQVPAACKTTQHRAFAAAPRPVIADEYRAAIKVSDACFMCLCMRFYDIYLSKSLASHSLMFDCFL